MVDFIELSRGTVFSHIASLGHIYSHFQAHLNGPYLSVGAAAVDLSVPACKHSHTLFQLAMLLRLHPLLRLSQPFFCASLPHSFIYQLKGWNITCLSAVELMLRSFLSASMCHCMCDNYHKLESVLCSHCELYFQFVCRRLFHCVNHLPEWALVIITETVKHTFQTIMAALAFIFFTASRPRTHNFK